MLGAALVLGCLQPAEFLLHCGRSRALLVRQAIAERTEGFAHESDQVARVLAFRRREAVDKEHFPLATVSEVDSSLVLVPDRIGPAVPLDVRDVRGRVRHHQRS